MRLLIHILALILLFGNILAGHGHAGITMPDYTYGASGYSLQRLTQMKTGNNHIDGTTGNLTSRKGMTGSEENFFYDPVNRLESVKHGNTETMAMEYFPNGNIKSKTGLGKFYYGNGYAGPHALVGVENTSGLINHRGQKAGYTSFGKVAWVIDTIGTDACRLDITYGPDMQRWKTILKKNGSETKEIIFAGNYERITENGVTRELCYIGGNAIVVKNDGASTLYYVHPDHLGSFAVITDVMGNIVQKCSYDAWGNREFEVKDPSLIFDRGFTGHEHLPEFGLINMNGRMYDPVVGRFLSPDPYVVDPQYNQDYNRYSYARNNPLIFTDPDGEWIILVGAIIVAYLGGSAANQNFNPVKWDYGSGATWMGMIGGAIQGAASVAGLQAGFAQMGWSNLATFGRSASTANLLTGRIPYVLLMLNCIKNFLLLQKNQKLKGMCLAEVILPFINRGMFLAGVILPFINRGMFLAGVILPFINRRMCLAEVILPFINRGMFLAGVILPFINRGMFLAGVILPFINRRMCLAEVILPFINRGMFLAGVILPFTNRGMCLAGVILPFANRRMSLAGVIAPCEDLCILPAEFPLRFAA